MRKVNNVNSARGVCVGVVAVALANAGTTWAESDELPPALRARISRTLVEEGYSSAAGGFDTEVKITASDGAGFDNFGCSVAISGDTAIVGARWDDDNGTSSGSAYVFQRDEGGVDNWGQVAKITASDGAIDDWFGWSVAINGDTAIVGAFLDDDNGSDSGSAYVFRRDEGGVDNWGQVTKITASDGAVGDNFGESVAISGDTAIVGAHCDDDNGSASGSAYVYGRDEGGVDNWGQVSKITASDGVASDGFGFCVAISGDTAIVGALGDDDNGTASGSAYVYRRDEGGVDNWGEVNKIIASDGAVGDSFGVSVSISGDTAIVGAFFDDDNGSDSGSAYVFRRDEGGVDNWGEVAKITASDGAATDFFGGSVGISGDTAIVGARFDNDHGSHSGSAYVYQRNEGGIDNWGEATKITASDGESHDELGFSVAVSGDTVIVGAWLDNNDELDCGSAYLFWLAVTPTESYPPGDSIDARQPSDLACTELFGWDSIDIVYDGDTAGVQAADFTVTVDPADVTPPGIVNVVSDGSTAALEFDMLIPLGHWTIITHDASGFVTRIGALPADVSGDGTSGPVDILDLIDFLNEVGPALEIWQTDIDRSGEANPADILGVIDLLNGAGCFDAWNGETLPE